MVTYIDGEVTTNGTRGRGQGVGGTEEHTANLYGVTTLPDHGSDGTAQHVLNQTGEEGLVLEIGIVGLEVLLGGGDELEGNQLVAR